MTAFRAAAAAGFQFAGVLAGDALQKIDYVALFGPVQSLKHPALSSCSSIAQVGFNLASG